MFWEILKVSTKMTPKMRMRRPPSKTGSSILPVSCRYPHIITYTEASVITAGSKSVDTVPTWVAMKLFTCPVSHVKKLVHITGRLASLGFSLRRAPIDRRQALLRPHERPALRLGGILAIRRPLPLGIVHAPRDLRLHVGPVLEVPRDGMCRLLVLAAAGDQREPLRPP